MPGLLDTTEQTYRYYRHAVENHWDPHDIDLTADREAVTELDDLMFTNLRGSIAAFGAGEESVAEDLAPLAVVLDDVQDEMFVTTQLYEEAKHADFFDRYWQTVVTPEEERRGMEETSPTDDQWFSDAYVELFDRMEDSLNELLVEDTAETRAKAYCHYHLTVEGILAQTAYYGLHRSYGPAETGLPTLPGLTAGLERIRGDEGRHVGFGMHKLRELVADGVDPQSLHATVNDLLGLVTATTTHLMADVETGDEPGPGPDDLRSYAAEKHVERMGQITDDAASIPAVEDLVRVETDAAAGE